MTAFMISAVWFPTVATFFRHCDIQPGSCFSGCQGLFAMGMLNGWGADLPHLQNILFQIILFNFFFWKCLPFGTLLCTVLANCKNFRTAWEMYCGLYWHCSHIPFSYQADNSNMFYVVTYIHFCAYLKHVLLKIWVKNVKGSSEKWDPCNAEYIHSYSVQLLVKVIKPKGTKASELVCCVYISNLQMWPVLGLTVLYVS